MAGNGFNKQFDLLIAEIDALPMFTNVYSRPWTMTLILSITHSLRIMKDCEPHDHVYVRSCALSKSVTVFVNSDPVLDTMDAVRIEDELMNDFLKKSLIQLVNPHYENDIDEILTLPDDFCPNLSNVEETAYAE
jgi:hypothetical protein